MLINLFWLARKISIIFINLWSGNKVSTTINLRHYDCKLIHLDVASSAVLTMDMRRQDYYSDGQNENLDSS